jgi:hypothetical protein
MSYSIIEKTSYTLYLNSADKISGNNNNSTYQVNWNDILPIKYLQYKMIWNLNTVGGYYKDTASVSVNASVSTSGSTNLNVSSSTNIVAGMIVTSSSSTYFTVNTYVVSVTNGTQVVISNPLLANVPLSTPLVFTGSIYSGAKVNVNFGTRSYSFDTSTKSASYCIGYIQRDPQSSTTSSNTLSCFYAQNPPKTMNRPNQNIINIQVYNAQNPAFFFVNTDNSGNALSDMTAFNMCIEFVPIDDSIISDQKLLLN